MSNEIKEILDETKRLVDNSDYKSHYHYNIYFEVEHIAKLLDYITNLQEENKRLRKDNGRLMQDNVYTLELERRNAKAIEYIKENQDMVEWIHIPGWELLNILQGEDKERLNNIINELENKIYYLYNYAGLDTNNLDKELKELKEKQ